MSERVGPLERVVQDLVSREVVPRNNISRESPSNGSHNLHEITRFFKTPSINPATGDVVELVGGEDVAVVSALCYVNGICFGVEGESGSGKSLIMDKWSQIVRDDELMTVKQATNKALHSMAAEINTKRWVYFAEIQKIASGNNGGKSIIELLKDLSEGRPARFTYYISRNKAETAIIAPINVCYTRALENSWNLDRELSRRFVKLVTDSGIEHTREVNQKQLENWVRLDYGNQADGYSALLQHLHHVSGLKNMNYIDPFAFAFGERIKDIPRSDSFLPLYGNLLRASAKYHINDRLKIKHNNRQFVLLQIEDHYNVSEAYHKHFTRALGEWNGTELEAKPVDWSRYFEQGAMEVFHGENLSKLREKKDGIIERWVANQTSGQDIIAKDFRTGNQISIGIYNGP
jgi:hypothetical protein